MRLPALPDFHFRESEAEPKMTPPPSQVQPQGTTPDSSEDLFAGMLAETDEVMQSPQPEQTEDLFEGLLAGAR